MKLLTGNSNKTLSKSIAKAKVPSRKVLKNQME